jgi:hypothetical protein
VRRLRSPTLSWKTMEMACEEQLEGFPGEGLSVLRRFALGGFVEYGGPGREREGTVSRAFPSWNRSILTEIYPCHARSCHTKCEISKLRVETPGQAEAEAACRAAGYSGLLQRALDVKLRLPRQQAPVPDTPPRTTVHMTGLGDHTSASPPLPSRRRRIGVSRRLRVRLSVAEERVIADRRQTTQTSMIASETMRAAR